MANESSGHNKETGVPSRHDRFLGCLLGGAVGDALGAPIEFDSWSEIQGWFGAGGLRDYAAAYGRRGAITDDTQMTLFTAEGLIRARNRSAESGIADVDAVMHRAYERWLLTQVGDPEAVPWDPDFGPRSNSGWLVTQPFLQQRRAPGNTCLRALLNGYRLGTPTSPMNQSKGCGGVMRVAPVGLVCDADSFDLGCRFAALTHGHPSGWMAAGALAAIVEQVTRGVDLDVAAQNAAERCQGIAGGYEVAEALEAAVALSQTSRRPSTDDIESLGEGWVAEEALAISVYCALTAADFRDGVLNAVNHSGDSDSTGSITGNLLGTSLGVGAIDDGLLEPLEGRQVIEQIADDLYYAFVGGWEPDSERYPPW